MKLKDINEDHQMQHWLIPKKLIHCHVDLTTYVQPSISQKNKSPIMTYGLLLSIVKVDANNIKREAICKMGCQQRKRYYDQRYETLMKYLDLA